MDNVFEGFLVCLRAAAKISKFRNTYLLSYFTIETTSDAILFILLVPVLIPESEDRPTPTPLATGETSLEPPRRPPSGQPSAPLYRKGLALYRHTSSVAEALGDS